MGEPSNFSHPMRWLTLLAPAVGASRGRRRLLGRDTTQYASRSNRKDRQSDLVHRRGDKWGDSASSWDAF